jgi:hypothetical protein
MAGSKSDKVAVLQGAQDRAEAPPKSPPPFTFGIADLDAKPDIDIGLPSFSKRQAAGPVMEGVNLAGRPKIILLAGRGKTGKTTAIRWMAELALSNDRPLLMGDLDPTNASFSTYFQGVHRPADVDSPAIMLKWLEQFLSHTIRHRQTAVVDLGGGDTTLRRLVDELPDLVQMAADEGSALAMFYHVGPQVDDLSPIATMEERGFQPEATAIVMNEAGIDPGLTREQAFARIHKHRVFRTAVERGAVPVWMPRLLVADAIEARRLHFLPTRDGATGPDGKPALGAFDRARLRSWLAAMDEQFAGVRTWFP